MKIGIITFHYAHNYGAVLQAYALCSKLRKEGYDAKIVDLRRSFIYNQYLPLELFYFYNNYRCQNSKLLSLIKACKCYWANRKRDIQWKRFDKFINNVLPHTKRIFEVNEIDKLGLDAYISGSDQIWNDHLTNGFDSLYFCDGFGIDKLKIAYAASNGFESIDDDKFETFKSLISNFDAISIREKGLSDFLKAKGVSNTNVLDPIFLLDKNDWANISAKVPCSNYLLTYSFSEEPNFFSDVLSFAKSKGLKVVSILFNHRDDIDPDIIQITDAGPMEFLGYFRNASFVITNSFHGTAFSILHEKQFVCVPPQKARGRIDSLLMNLGLTDRIQTSNFNSDRFIDYKNVTLKLNELRNESLLFLKSNLKIK